MASPAPEGAGLAISRGNEQIMKKIMNRKVLLGSCLSES